jgi:hypothetical protein
MKVPYYCPYCDQRSTRRWNLDVHIKRRHGGYLLGRSSGRYVTNNPPLYSKSLLGHATIADSVGETFQPRYIPQQAPIGTSPSTIRPPLHTMGDQRNGSLSPDAIQKIQELKALMNKYPR